MAYSLADQNQDEDPDQEKTQVATSAPLATYGQSGGTAPGSSGAPAGTPDSSFVNFDRYFNANAGNAQAQASRVATQVGNEASGAEGDLNSALSTYADRTKAGRPGIYGGGYNGPGLNTFDPGNSADELTRAQNDLNSTKDVYGIQNFFPNESQGNSTFDAALTNRAGGDQFAALRKQYAGIDSALQNAYQTANQDVTDSQNYRPPSSTTPAPTNEQKRDRVSERQAGNEHVQRGNGYSTGDYSDYQDPNSPAPSNPAPFSPQGDDIDENGNPIRHGHGYGY